MTESLKQRVEKTEKYQDLRSEIQRLLWNVKLVK